MTFEKPWEILRHVITFTQFPFRLTIFPAVFLSLTFALLLGRHRRRKALLTGMVLCLAANLFWMIGGQYHFPIVPQDVQGMRYAPWPSAQLAEKVDKGKFASRDYLETAVNQALDNSAEKFRELAADREVREEGRIQEVRRKGSTFQLTYRAGTGEWIRLPVFWYMGYVARDREDVWETYPIRKDEDGRLLVLLPSAAGSMQVSYEGLPWFHLTDLVSWFSLFLFLRAAYRARRGC